LLLIWPLAVRLGALPPHEETVCAAGRTDADTAIPPLAPLPHSSLYVALLEVLAVGVSTLSSAHPEVALVALTVSPVTVRCPAAANLSVCTAPGFPDE
jgi:hypothetical protein